MINFLVTPGIDTGTEIGIGVYNEYAIDELKEELLRLLDTGKPGDMILVVKAQAANLSLEDLTDTNITTEAHGITPDIWEIMDSYLNWLKKRDK